MRAPGCSAAAAEESVEKGRQRVGNEAATHGGLEAPATKSAPANAERHTGGDLLPTPGVTVVF